MNFQPNDKVVCVDAKPRKNRPVCGLQCGQVYCVRSVMQSPVSGKWGIRLVGITLEVVPFWNIEQAFAAERFRKVEDVGHPLILEREIILTA